MRTSFVSLAACLAALAAAPCYGQRATEIPRLEKQGAATRLIVDGQPFLALAGELGNNTATSLENVAPLWPKLAAGNLNCVLAAISWAQMEPSEGRYEFALVDGLIDAARRHDLKLVFLWFGSWKNGLSSYAPYWVKSDFRRFSRVRLGAGQSIEILSTFGDATRDADARAFRALMRHIKAVDGARHTVVMMQVENEVGVLRDSRDRSPIANQAFAAPVPPELMAYLQQHRADLAPELRELWAANGSRTAGAWEQVFGPGKPASVAMPIQTTAPPMTPAEHESAWRSLHWPSDEIFMAWNYARYVGKVVAEGKREYALPMFVNAWLQQPNHAWPGTYPSGGPLPQVHDIWRAGAPAIDVLAPDLYVPYFDEVSERFTRNANPLFIPETGANASNVLMAFGKFNAIGFSPFFIERTVGPDTDLAAAYRVVSNLAPAIAAHQGTPEIAAIRTRQGDPPAKLALGGYTLDLTFTGRGRPPIAPTAQAAQTGQQERVEGSAIFVAAAPNEFFMGAAGGGVRIAFTPTTPGPATVGLGDVQEGRFVDGQWTVLRQLAGDDTGQGEILTLRPNTTLRVTVYRYE
jgi:hypothetical protein